MSPRKQSIVVAAIAVYNLVQNLVLPRSAYVPGNLVASGGLLAIARRYGCSWGDLGLDGKHVARGLRHGLIGALVAGGATWLGSLHPRSRAYFLDRRAVDQGGSDLAYQVLVRFPLGTALFEEVAFRGVSHAIWRRQGSTDRAAALASGLLFAAWHVVPTFDALDGNPAGSMLTSTRSRATVVAAGAVASGLAGVGLGWLRRWSGSLLTPWMVHTAFNSAGYLAGVAVWRRSGQPGRR